MNFQDCWWNISISSLLILAAVVFEIFVYHIVIIRSTPPIRRNKVGLKCPSARPYVHPSVRPSTKCFFDFNEIWRVGRGHEPLKVGNSAISQGYLLPHL